jgi:protease secretion system membrane fusion protein
MATISRIKPVPSNEEVIEEKDIHDVNTDASTHTKLGWWIVLAGVGGFLLWAMFAPLDKGVPVSGTVTVAGNRKAVQHLNGGTIDDILVREGDVVKAGQVLVRMNDVQAKSQAEMARAQYFSSLATEARLIAERDGKSTIAFSPELLKAKSDLRAAENMSLQSQLFFSRRGAIQSELSSIDENIRGLQLQKDGLEDSVSNQKIQQGILKEQLADMRDLAKEGYVARNRVLDLERTYAAVNGTLSESLGNLGRIQRQISEYTLRRNQRQQEYQKEVRSQLAEVQRDVKSLESRLKGYDYDLANAEVKSPVDGTVVGMSVFTKGGVIGPGYKLMDVVPADDPLIVEGQVPVNLIDKVHKDLEVEMIFSAFNQNQTPHVPGKVTQVSADRLVDEKSGMPYYRVKAQVTPEGKKIIQNLQVRPGMPVELLVKTGERTMMSYLLKPLIDRSKTSLIEE